MAERYMILHKRSPILVGITKKDNRVAIFDTLQRMFFLAVDERYLFLIKQNDRGIKYNSAIFLSIGWFCKVNYDCDLAYKEIERGLLKHAVAFLLDELSGLNLSPKSVDKLRHMSSDAIN